MISVLVDVTFYSCEIINLLLFSQLQKNSLISLKPLVIDLNIIRHDIAEKTGPV